MAILDLQGMQTASNAGGRLKGPPTRSGASKQCSGGGGGGDNSGVSLLACDITIG